MSSWWLLLCAIALEVMGTTALRQSEGFSRLWPSVAVVVLYCSSFYLLAQTLKRLEIGIAYAVWSGLGTAVVALIGIVLFKESVSALKLASLALIVLGVIGLNMAGQGH